MKCASVERYRSKCDIVFGITKNIFTFVTVASFDFGCAHACFSLCIHIFWLSISFGDVQRLGDCSTFVQALPKNECFFTKLKRQTRTNLYMCMAKNLFVSVLKNEIAEKVELKKTLYKEQRKQEYLHVTRNKSSCLLSPHTTTAFAVNVPSSLSFFASYTLHILQISVLLLLSFYFVLLLFVTLFSLLIHLRDVHVVVIVIDYLIVFFFFFFF